MILVIFGAGASYDSVPALPPEKYKRENLDSRLPLAKELFLDIGPFAEGLSRFEDCHPIVPYLRNVPEDQTLEQVLENLQTEAEKDPVRKRQLAAVQFYLHYVIWECERKWSNRAGKITNYLTLLDQLRCVGEPVCIVTFNYDLNRPGFAGGWFV